MTEHKKFKSVIPDWIREISEESDKLQEEIDRIALALYMQEKYENEWTMTKEIDMLIQEHTTMKKPTKIVMSVPVHNQLVGELEVKLHNVFPHKKIQFLKEYKGLEVVVLDRHDTVLLLG